MSQTKMLITVSNELCDNLDRHKKPSHFTNRLPLVITAPNESMKEIASKYYIRLEGISVLPWPKKPLIICCSLCDQQLFGHTFEKVLGLTYGPQKFTKPKVPTQMTRSDEIEIELKSIDGETINNIQSATVQLSIEKYE